MASTTTRALATGATVVSGLLAGANVDRNLVQMPAWRHLGAEAWAAYSRQADLRYGLMVYPVEAVGAAALTVGTAVSLSLDRSARREAAVPICAAAALAIGGLLATTRAAPAVWSLRTIGDDPAAVQRAFERFRFWGLIRGVAQTLSFGANVWAMTRLLR